MYEVSVAQHEKQASMMRNAQDLVACDVSRRILPVPYPSPLKP